MPGTLVAAPAPPARCLDPAPYRPPTPGLGAAPNLKLYAARVDRIIGVDPNTAMQPYARQAAEACGAGGKLQLVTGRAEALPLPDASADAVVMTHVRRLVLRLRLGGEGRKADAALHGTASCAGPHSCRRVPPSPLLQVLCTVSDPQRALAEVRRVLRPGGRLLFLEHVAAEPGSWLLSLQRALNPAVHCLGHGCSATRRTLEAIEAAGFASVDAERFRLQVLPSPLLVIVPHVCGTAVR